MSFALTDSFLPFQSLELGQSDESKKAFEVERQAISHAREPLSQGGWKRELFDNAIDLYLKCSKESWDGYEASPITMKALEQTSSLIDSLPPWAPKPDIIPTPEGEISMEWHTLSKQVLSAYPKEEHLIYAASLGPMNIQYGRFPFKESWPEEILLMLKKYFSHANS